MRTFLFAVMVALLATAVVPAFIGRPRLLHRDAHTFNPINVHLRELLQHKPIVLTNAQRLARGLSLARPHFPRSDEPGTATPSSGSAGTAPTATCTAHIGSLNITGGSYTGSYVAAQANIYGEYGYTTSDADALQAQYTLCDGDAANGPLNIRTLNGLTTYPYFGAVVGFASTSDDFSEDSYTYAYIAGTTESDPGATPQSGLNAFTAATGTPRDFESAVWVFDAATTGAVSAQWINPDGSKPKTHLMYVPSSGAFAIASNVPAFEANFKNVTEVSFTFAEASASAVQ
ncbi:hypothetical protein FOMPIDRAFT_1165103 [Fomitopsis schrenkii]|uniref:Uncharacterized protein n=1 Tax=Fomitopsis schrenkii TaxID=2126942 RepID=S8E1V2_FOMSC|nr:hypothetical protein FOMPIDRAFT_1165103 [Fomitopsis schrenkii]